MNQGRIWCVVNPTVGLPLFLGSVALTSLAVHASVMTNTTWMSNYWQGSARGRTAADAGPAGPAVAGASGAFTVTVAPSTGSGPAPAAFVITVTPNPAVPAAADAGPPPTAAPMRSASAD